MTMVALGVWLARTGRPVWVLWVTLNVICGVVDLGFVAVYAWMGSTLLVAYGTAFSFGHFYVAWWIWRRNRPRRRRRRLRVTGRVRVNSMGRLGVSPT